MVVESFKDPREEDGIEIYFKVLFFEGCFFFGFLKTLAYEKVAEDCSFLACLVQEVEPSGRDPGSLFIVPSLKQIYNN